MSFIKISGIDENRNIVKWLKIADDEDEFISINQKRNVEQLIMKKMKKL